MEFLLLLHWAMHCVHIGLEAVLLPNYLVASCRYGISIVLVIGLIFRIAHLFEGGRLWTHFILFLSSDRSVS